MAERRTGKKLINDPETCVDENLEGFTLVNSGIKKVKGHRILVREDYQDLVNQGKVCILSGGGSGHEPNQAGFVGRGMLTCSVMGSIFAAPPSQELLLAIRLVARHNPAGCLVLIANYTGDRLNFGVAVEKAKEEGIKVLCVTVGEDCAMVPSSKSAGRRGLTGFVLAYKLAGALSEEGKSLEEIVDTLTRILKEMGSLGVCLTPCTVPGAGATFHIGQDEMELGLGVHGEPGVKNLKMTTAKETIQIMIDHMTSSENKNKLSLNKGEEVLCVINNLGGTTHLEMNILIRDLILYLTGLGVHVKRSMCGYLNTSQEMSGVVVTILKLDNVSTRLFDAPTDAPCWPRPLISTNQSATPIEIETDTELAVDSDCAVLETEEELDKMYAIIVNIARDLMSAESRLNKLDTEGGDGDCGTTLSKGAKVLLESIGERDNPGLPIDCPYRLALKLASIAENHMGGSTGALYSLFLTSGAVCLKQDISRESWCKALEQGISAIKKYGGAKEGDRTMLDPLCAVCEVLKNEIHNNDLGEILNLVDQTASEKAKETATMKAQAGRASYVRTDRLTQPDPGATAVSIWIKALVETLQKYHS